LGFVFGFYLLQQFFFVSLFVFFFLCHSFLAGDHHHCCSSTNLRFLPTVQILGAETFGCCINWVISEMLFFFFFTLV
jgi:hypothetical protein